MLINAKNSDCIRRTYTVWEIRWFLSTLTASEIGGIAIKAAVNQANIDTNSINEVILGNVLQGGQGQIPSRQAARKAELPWDVKTETINKVCASGMRSLTL